MTNSILCLRPRGKHIQVGLMLGDHAAPAVPMPKIVGQEIELLGSHGMQAHRYGAMLDMVESGKLDPARLVGDKIGIDAAGAMEIARRSRGTPRIANRLLRRVRDYAEVKADGHIEAEVADRALDMLSVDQQGFDHLDRRLLLAMIEKFDGGPVGVDSLAAAISEERGTIEDVLEPFLIQQGYIVRTPRGRMVTRNAYLHFGLPAPKAGEVPQGQLDLGSEEEA